ncbi:unnamed protein product, partial [Ectocarpus sp. 13 AM-2016]
MFDGSVDKLFFCFAWHHQTTNLLGQLLSAVGFLHQHGVVHRDVKPENILIDKKK